MIKKIIITETGNEEADRNFMTILQLLIAEGILGEYEIVNLFSPAKDNGDKR